MPKYVKNCQRLNKPTNTFQKLDKIYQSGEILPNLVPLTMILVHHCYLKLRLNLIKVNVATLVHRATASV